MSRIKSSRGLIRQVPGLHWIAAGPEINAEEEMARILRIIDVMTEEERLLPQRINLERRQSIAEAAVVKPADVSGVIRQFNAMVAFVERMAAMSIVEKIL